MSASTATIFMAILVLALGSARFLLDRKEHHGWLVRSLIGMGQLALSIYYVHLFAFVVAAAVAARLLGESLRLHAGWFPLLALATFLLVDGTINRLWARWSHRWSVEWWMARLVAGPTKGSTAPTTFAAESPLSRH